MKYCDYCGAKVNPGSTYCDECGGNLTGNSHQTTEGSRTVYCDECGAKVNPGSIYCDECGYPLARYEEGDAP